MNIKKISMCLALLLCLDAAVTEIGATETSQQATAPIKKAVAKEAAKRAAAKRAAAKRAAAKRAAAKKAVKGGQKNKKGAKESVQKITPEVNKNPVVDPQAVAVQPVVPVTATEAPKVAVIKQEAEKAEQQGVLTSGEANSKIGEANSKTLKERFHDAMGKKILKTALKGHAEELAKHGKTKEDLVSLRAEKEAKADPRTPKIIPKAPDLKKANEYFLARENNLSIPKEKKEAFVSKKATNNGPMVTEEGLKEGLKNLRPAGKTEKMETENERIIREIQSVKLRPAPVKEKTDVAKIVQGDTIIVPGGTNAVTGIVTGAVDTAKVAEDAARKAAAEKAAAEKEQQAKALEESRKNEENAHKAAADQEQAEKEQQAAKAAAEKAAAEKAAAEKAAAEKVVADQALEKAAAEKVVADQAETDQAATNKEETDKATDQAVTDQSAANNNQSGQ